MALQALDNPIWQSLLTCHRDFAVGNEQVKRYPSAIGPFIAVPTAENVAEPYLSRIVAAGETLYFVGVAPQLSAEWQLTEHGPIVQMLCPSRIELAENDVEISILSDPDIPAMMELTALVYPEYFRARTAELGAYLGIYLNGRLAAMAGERMHLTGYQEISAVCTHPDFTGRGYAAILVSRLVNAILERNEVPFLHVSRNNERAKSLYERLGFIARRELPLWAMTANSI
jgi:ribosomal protein S18 acetylase RimI-like enzyme